MATCVGGGDIPGIGQVAASKTDDRRLGRIQRRGVWLSVLPSTVNGTELRSQGWMDLMFLRYVIEPSDLLSHCNSYGVSFLFYHALEFKKGGLITARHNELCDGVANLAGKIFTPAHILNDTLMFTGCALRGRKPKPKANSRRHHRQPRGRRRGIS